MLSKLSPMSKIAVPAFLLCLHCIFLQSSGQSIGVGQQLLEDAVRRMELKDTTFRSASRSSFVIRPLHSKAFYDFDSVPSATSAIQPTRRYAIFNKKGTLAILPAAIQQQYNSHHPYGWNDGSLFPAKGYQVRASAGIFAELGILSIQLQPELVHAANPSFRGFSSHHNDSTWYYYYKFANDIDMPDRFGEQPLTRLFPGQSSIRLNYKGLSVGLSSENLWWGPGYRNSLLMSNTAPGFYHLTFNSTRPHKTFLGQFEWQLIAGRLENSGFLPPDTSRQLNGIRLYNPKKESNRYINGLVINWQPKWIHGLHLGFTRSFFQYSDNIQPGLNGYLPVFSAFFKGNSRDENSFGRDQMLSFFLRWLFPKEQAEIYAEWGRNDHSGNLTDFLQEPEHSRAYTIGLRKLFPLRKNRDLEFFTEITQTETPSTKLVRALQPWYVHYQVRHGYTHLGQVLGAGIGPGSNSQLVGVKWVSNLTNTTGITFDRIVRNNDFYYTAFAGSAEHKTHWVDLVLTGSKTWKRNKFVYSTHLALIRSMNYQWKSDYNAASTDNVRTNVNHLQAGFSIGFLF